ncbi:MAG: response regulator [bacterium]
MLDIGKLAEHLIGGGIIRSEQFEEAKRCVSGRKMTLDKALVTLKCVDYAQLGKCYSDMVKLPYMPVLSGRPPDEVRRLLSADCAGAWKIFPCAYDQYENVLTVAIHDPEQIALLEQVSRFYMQPYTMAFTIASLAEIEEALSVYYGLGIPSIQGGVEAGVVRPGVVAAGMRTGASGERKKIQLFDHSQSPSKEAGATGSKASPMPPKPLRPADSAPGKKGAKPAEVAGDKVSSGDAMSPEFSYAAMRGVLRSAAALTVRAYLAKNPERLQEVCARVRYCELLASRLTLSMVQSDAVVLAAWLSGMEEEHILKQLVTPYKLEELLSCGSRSEGSDRTEARILSLVKCFQDLTRTDPDSMKDVGLMRRLLRRDWSSSPVRQNMLETFLQVLMDEQFIDKLERATGKILIVDPTEGPTSIMAAPLVKYGYEVQTAVTAEACYEIMETFTPDLILCERDLPRESGIEFCEKIKGDSRTADVRVIMICKKVGKEYAAESLRAGADDFLQKPVNLEVLFLKIRQLLTTPAAEGGEKTGIRGFLHEMNFSDMIQILSAGTKSKEIILTRGKEEGHVFVENGEVIHAEVGQHNGEQAFLELMHWSDGEFTMKQCVVFPARSINAPVMSLLMQGATAIDEKKAAEARTSSPKEDLTPTPPPVAASQQQPPSGA